MAKYNVGYVRFHENKMYVDNKLLSIRTQDTRKRVEDAIRRLDNYLLDAPLECFDRLDFKETPPFPGLILQRIKGNIAASALLKLLYACFWVAPFLMRRVFKVQPALTASGIAFLAQGYLTSFEVGHSEGHLERAKLLLETLKQLNAGTSVNPSWGLPYDWQSFELMPKNTPLGYTTVTCAEAFLMYARLSGDEDALGWAIRACHLFHDGLNHTSTPGGGVSLSYSPRDNSQVVNVSILAAGLMAELDNFANSTDHSELVENLVRFGLDSQNDDGGWYYAKGVTRIDGYHTAMVLQGLAKVLLFGEVGLELETEIRKAIVLGLTFYLHRLWKKGIPANTTLSQFPLEVMTTIEALICFNYLRQIRDHLPDELLEKMEDCWATTADWTIRNLQAQDGSFSTLYIPLRSIHLHSLRWGDALMLRALVLTESWLSINQEKP